MQFLKKHFEKIILSVVLLGLAVAAAYLPIKVSRERQTLQDASLSYFRATPKALRPLDMSTNENALKRLVNPPRIALAKPGHNVFNPIKWKKKPDGTPFPDTDMGLKMLTVTNVAPLYLKIDYRGPRDSGENLRYEFRVTREASTNVALRQPVTRTAALGAKNDVFTVKDIKGPKDNPEEILLDLNEFKTTVSVSREKTVSVVAGYAADLWYEPDRKNFIKQHVGQKLTLSGTLYNIVAISQSDVTVEDSKSKKRTTIHWNAAPAQ